MFSLIHDTCSHQEKLATSGNTARSSIFRVPCLGTRLLPNGELEAAKLPEIEAEISWPQNFFLEPQTTIYKWLFQLDDSQSLHRKWLFHQTSIFKWLFGVPGLRHLHRCESRWRSPAPSSVAICLNQEKPWEWRCAIDPFQVGYITFTPGKNPWRLLNSTLWRLDLRKTLQSKLQLPEFHFFPIHPKKRQYRTL